MKKALVCSAFLLFMSSFACLFDQVAAYSKTKGEKRITLSEGSAVEPDRVVFKLRPHSFPSQLKRTGLARVDAAFASGEFRLQDIRPVLKDRRSPVRDSRTTGLDRLFFATIASDQSPQSVARKMSERPEVEYAEPLYRHRLDARPNDPRFGEQSYFDIINMESAWDIAKGSSGDVVVAIIDGGTDIDHDDLAANLWVNPGEIPGNKQDDDNNGFIDDIHGWNFLTAGSDASGSSRMLGSANHGTNVAGVACAATDNNIGVAGTSWNARLMAINAADPVLDGFISLEFGYAGILYAAQNGADVINLSWSRNGGPPSFFEQDVLQFARERGCAIVAAAGNEGTEVPSYPASYSTVLSVAWTDASDIKAALSNYGRTVNMTAPGTNILNTFHNNRYGAFGGGTSFSAPMVAGVVALVRTFRPDLTGAQAAEQVRVTADNIDAMNPGLAGLLGTGRLNAARALSDFTLPSIRLADLTIIDENEDGTVRAGESVLVEADFINYLSAASSIRVTLTTSDPSVTLVTSTGEIARLPTLERMTTPLHFRFDVSEDTEIGSQLDFSLEIASGVYRDREHFTVLVEPPFMVLNVNNIETAVTNVGTIGFADLAEHSGGFGFSFQRSNNLLFEGSMIMGTGPARISNTARVLSTSFFSKDFRPLEGAVFETLTPGRLTRQESFATLVDDKASAPMGLIITQRTFAEAAPPNDDFVILRYRIENGGLEKLENFRFGLFFDWDIGDELNDSVRFVTEEKLGYVWDGDIYVGTALLSDSLASFRILDNADDEFDINDTFTDAEKWQTLNGGAPHKELFRRDVAYVISAGPYSMLPGESVEIGFAMLGGESTADIEDNAAAARTLWQTRVVTSVSDPQMTTRPRRFNLAQNYPNPFNPVTQIRFTLPRAQPVALEIYSILGQKIRTLLTETLPAGNHSVRWDGRDDTGRKAASGVYIYRLQAGDFRATRKLTLLR